MSADNTRPEDTRTLRQKGRLLSLLVDLRKLYPNARIIGHRDLSEDKNGNGIIEPSEWMKACPCFDAKSEYHRIYVTLPVRVFILFNPKRIFCLD